MNDHTNGTYQIVPQPDVPMLWGMSTRTRFDRQFASLVPQPSGWVLLLREDAVFDAPVLRALATSAGAVAVTDPAGQAFGARVEAHRAEAAAAWMAGGGTAPEGMTTASPAAIAGTYDQTLRKRAPSQCHRLSVGNRAEVEWALFQTSYKGVTDFVTKFLWPRPAFAVTRWCALNGVTPNQVTLVSFLLVVACYFLFANGYFWTGMLLAWLMTFLDTVDGKLARVSVKSSPFGNIFDHGIDLVHPPFWYYAWGLGLAYSTTPLREGWFGPLIGALIAGYVGGRLIEGYFIRRFGMHIYVWRQFDAAFRLVIARRNPNMVLMQASLIFARPDIGFLLVVGWTLVSLAIQIVILIQAEISKRRQGKLRSWLDQS
jgi:phosphatidylglycerophosphate synthase